MNMKAEATSWECTPFENGVPITVEVEGTAEDFANIEMGFIPQRMEDKWFIYYEAPYLYLHRSWTGRPVYRLETEKADEKFSITEALFSSELAKKDELEYAGKLAKFLVSNILLGREVDFPVPSGVKEPAPGVYQHHVAGSGYREEKE